MDLMKIGIKIRQIRKGRKLTQHQLAERSGVSHSVLQELERGLGNPTLKTLDALTKALKCRFIDLLEASIQPPPVSQPLGRETNWAECARVLEALHTVSEPRRLCALYFLLDDEKYLVQLEAFEDFRPIVAALKIAL